MYLVTGGAGFIGSNIVEELLRMGKKVRILDNFSSGRMENIALFRKDIELLEGSVTDPEMCLKATSGVKVVFHEAAVASVPKSVADPVATNEVNLTGSLNILNACRKNGVGKFVFASSSAIYGDDPELPKRENMLPKPISPYALHKLAVEYYNRLFFSLYGLETISLRYFNVFGPRQDPRSDYAAVIPKFINMMLAGKSPTIYGDGRQTRDFIYVKDVVRANILASESKEASGEIINVAGGKDIDLLDLVNDLNAVLKSELKPVFLPAQPGDVPKSVASTEKMKNVLNFLPEHDFKSGLKNTVEYYSEVLAFN
ncbi:MAG: SDR family oxidoreductase [Candidatus Riflebacteria bacterium]|nr:SDR family oxidoreductase [Candidatus Riflebacteria bacterium]